MQIDGIIQQSGMQLSRQLMQERVHLGFGFQHSIQINVLCN